MKYSYLIMYTIFIAIGCKNYNEAVERYLDLTPPSLLGIDVTGENSITINCNEQIEFIQPSYISREGIEIESVSYNNNSITLNFNTALIPGLQYRSEFRIEDNNGNSLSFIANYYGYNSNKPEVIINEFIVKGSKSNPNKIELYVKKGGNLAGLTLYNGTKNSYDSAFIFPSIPIKTGEYIVFRTISDKYPIPYTEIDDLSVKHDKKFIDNVRDIRADNFKLSSTNGVISLYSDPYGKLLDSVIYSKNHNDSSKRYRNFGLSKTMIRVDEIGNEGGWIGEYETLFPDDVVFSGNSTSTRSLNRVGFIDSNNNSDWITVATRGATFGMVNSTNKY